MQMKNALRLATGALAIAMLAATGCKKKVDDSAEHVIITNYLDEEVTLDIYQDHESYAHNTNLYHSQKLGPREKWVVPTNTLKNGATYYIDWYAKDYQRTNWLSDQQIPDNWIIKPVKGNNTYSLNPTYKSNARTTFLNNTDTVTKWVAVGAYLSSSSTGYVSFWDSLDVNGKYRTVSVRKNLTASLSYKDTLGNVITEQYPFIVQPTESAYIEFRNPNSATVAGSMIGGRLPTGDAPEYKSNSTDTVMALLPYSEYYFMMVKQK